MKICLFNHPICIISLANKIFMLEQTLNKNLYDHPKYYDWAICSFRDVKKEVDFIRECINRFSRIEVKNVIELACGPAPNAEKFTASDFQYHGIDISPAMIDYCIQKYASLKDKVHLIRGNMLDFKVDNLIGKADLVLIMCGSFFPKNQKDIIKNLDSVALHLRKGGLYILDSCIVKDYGESEPVEYSLEVNNTPLFVRLKLNIIDQKEHLIEYILNVQAMEKDKILCFKSSDTFMEITFQDLDNIIRTHPQFELCGFFNDFSVDDPFDKKREFTRPLTIMRRI